MYVFGVPGRGISGIWWNKTSYMAPFLLRTHLELVGVPRRKGLLIFGHGHHRHLDLSLLIISGIFEKYSSTSIIVRRCFVVTSSNCVHCALSLDRPHMIL